MSTTVYQGELISDTGRRLPSSYKWVIVAMLWCITFFNYADRMALNANMPLIKGEFGLDKTTGGMLGAAFGYTYGLCALFAGFTVDRVRRKTAVLLGLLVWSLICMGTATAHTFWMLFAFLALEGLGEAFYFPAAMSMMSDYHGKATRSKAMSINQTSVYFGTIGGTFFAGYLGKEYGWRSAFLAFGAMGLLLAVLLWRFLHEPPRGAADRVDSGVGEETDPHLLKHVSKGPADTTPYFNLTGILGLLLLVFGALLVVRAAMTIKDAPTIAETIRAYVPWVLMTLFGLVFTTLRRLRKDREFWSFFRVFISTPTAVLLLLAFLCANSVATILLVWMPTFVFENIYASDKAMLAIAGTFATMPLQLASMIGSPGGGALADYLRARTPRGRILVQMLGVLCAVPFVFLCGQVHGKWALILLLACWGLFKGIYDSNIWASIYDVVRPELRGMTTGFMNMVAWGGGALAPVGAGYIADSYKDNGLGRAISGASGIYIVSGLLLFMAAMLFVTRDSARMQAQIKATAQQA
jgi:MFS family permease